MQPTKPGCWIYRAGKNTFPRRHMYGLPAIVSPQGRATGCNGARRSDHHRISSVGEEVDGGSRIVRGVEAANNRWNKIADIGDRPHLFDPGPGDQDVAWSAFLQEQLSGLHARLGVKARAHHAVV